LTAPIDRSIVSLGRITVVFTDVLQTLVYNTSPGTGNGSSNGNSGSGTSRARQRKPSAIRVIVSRLSASIASMTDTADQEDEMHLLASSSSDDVDPLISHPDPSSQLEIPDAPRRGSASSVTVTRALFPLHLPHLSRVNSF
ncbi:hypothetical protein PMAYCL1PPCAC_02240, partial [Pristionchus mayeri]